MHELEVTWACSLKVWWAFVQRASVFGFIIAFIPGFILGFVGVFCGWAEEAIMQITQIIGFIIGLVTSFFVMRFVIKKRFRDFRIVLLAPTLQENIQKEDKDPV